MTITKDKRKKSKILIVTPSSEKTMSDQTIMLPSMGVVRLAHFLVAKGYDAEYFDINFYTVTSQGPSLADKLKEKDWDIIGFSVLNETLIRDIENMYLAKKLCPDALLVAGGIEAQFNYQTILDKTPCKIVVLGEGEIPMTMLAEGVPLLEIPGIVLRNNAMPLTQKQFCEATNAIAWEKIPFEKYWDFYITKYGDKYNKQAETEIHTVRVFSKNRCPFACTYCSSVKHLMLAAGNKYVPVIGLTRANIIGIIEKIIQSHPRVKTVYFTDDDFCIDRKYVIDICNKIAERNFGISFMCLARISDLDAEVIECLSRANFRKLNIGVESFSQKILDELNKKCKSEIIHENLALLRKYKLNTYLNIILATPKSTLDDLEDTADKTIYYIKDGFFNGGITMSIVPLKGSCICEMHSDYMADIEGIPGTKYTLKRDRFVYSQDPYVKEAQIRYYREIDKEIKDKRRELKIVHGTAPNLAMIRLLFVKKIISEIREKYNIKREDAES